MADRRRDPLSGEWRSFGAPAGAAELDELAGQSYQIAVVTQRTDGAGASSTAGLPMAPRTYERSDVAVRREVVAYADRADLSFARLSSDRASRLVDVWADRYRLLAREPEVRYVLVLEHASAQGRPHQLVYGLPEIPLPVLTELRRAADHHAAENRCPTCDLVALDVVTPERLVTGNAHFVAVVPFAARFPYEVQVFATRHATSVSDLTDPERASLAQVLLDVTRCYAVLEATPLPYVMSVSQSPTDDGEWLHVSHLHVDLWAGRGKDGDATYLAEALLGAGPVNPVQPEEAAADLRAALRRDESPSG